MQKKCIAKIYREFVDVAFHLNEGMEVEYIYENHPCAEKIQKCTKVEEVNNLIPRLPRYNEVVFTTQIEVLGKTLDWGS